MIFETDPELFAPDAQRGAAVGAALPESLAWTERAAAALRAYLDQHDLAHYRIFYVREHELSDLDAYIGELTHASPTPSWEPAPAATAGGQAPAVFRIDRAGDN